MRPRFLHEVTPHSMRPHHITRGSMLRDADACTEYMYMCVYIRKSWVLELYLAMALAKFRSAKGASHHPALTSHCPTIGLTC